MSEIFVLFMRVLPRNLLSYAAGWVARLRLPPIVQQQCNRVFVRIFRINMNEAERSLSTYTSIEDVFGRKLKAGSRSILGSFVSPSDGFLARSGPIQAGQLIQAKGLYYQARELVFGGFECAEPEPEYTWFTTVYLAPHNYHRVHAPVAGRLTCIRHLPASLWPVNLPFVEHLPRLFCRNERLVFDIRLVDGETNADAGIVHAVMVGAFNVGRMITPFLPDFATNDWERIKSPRAREFRLNEQKPGGPSLDLKAGEELGTFLLGSTVVLVLDQRAASRFRPVQAEGNRPILMGQALS